MNKWPWLGPEVRLLCHDGCLLKLLDLSCQCFIPMGPVGYLSFASRFSTALAWQIQWAEPHHCCCLHVPLPLEQSCVPGKSPSGLRSPLSARGALVLTLSPREPRAEQLCWVSQCRSVWVGVSQHRDGAQPQAAAFHSDCGTLQGLGLMLKQWPLSLELLSCTGPWHHRALQCHWCLLLLLWDQTGKGWEGASETTQSIFATL